MNKQVRRRRFQKRRQGGNVGPNILVGRSAINNIPRIPNQAIVTVRKWTAPTVINQLQADAFGTIQFELVDTEASSFAALYEQYRITKVEVFFRAMYRANPIIDDTVCIIPLIFVAVDPNDISAWTVLTQAQYHENVTVVDDKEPICVRFEPSTATALYNGTFAGFGHTRNVWVDTSYNTVRYFGVKWAITGSGFAASHYQAWHVTVRETIQFRFGR